MPQTRGHWPELYDNIDKVVISLLRGHLQELPPIYTKYYNVESTDKAFERVHTITPFGRVPEKPEGEVYALDLLGPGWTKDFIASEYGLGFAVTETALEDDKYDQLVRATEWLAYSARYVREERAAVPFNTGFSATGELAPDGKPLFAPDHILRGGGTAANTFTVQEELSLQALINAFRDVQVETKLENGFVVAPITNWYLLVHPHYEMAAHRYVMSEGLPDSANQDDNPIRARRRIEIVVNPHLADPDAWFLIPQNRRMHGLTVKVRVKPTLAPPMTDPYTGNRIYRVRFRQAVGAKFWQGLFGSSGA